MVLGVGRRIAIAHGSTLHIQQVILNNTLYQKYLDAPLGRFPEKPTAIGEVRKRRRKIAVFHLFRYF